MTKLAADPLVESLLLLHDLHPLPVADRVRKAINAVMPQLGAHAGQAEFAGLDEAGVVRIRLELSDHGRQAHAGAVQEAIEQAVADAAPDAAGVSFDVVTAAPELPLLQIGRSPAARGAQ
jgi:Fe-S cluster biogenesis protein NfuA